MNFSNPTASISPASPQPSNKSRPTLTSSPRLALSTIADKCRSSQGILTPTETLELLDIAEYFLSKYDWAMDEITALEWDLSHPLHKDL